VTHIQAKREEELQIGP